MSRAASLIARCSSLKSKFIARSASAQTRQAQDPLGHDVLEDLGGTAFDRVGPRAQEPAGPGLLLELGALALDVHRQLGERLVDLRPVPLAQGALWAGDAVLHRRGQP